MTDSNTNKIIKRAALIIGIILALLLLINLVAIAVLLYQQGARKEKVESLQQQQNKP